MKISIQHDSDEPGYMILTAPVEMLLPHSGKVRIQDIPYRWNGNSTPPLPLMRFIVPRFFFLIASLFHDFLCEKAQTKEDRKKADKDYKWILINLYRQRISAFVGYLGVRIGAFFNKRLV